MRPIVRTGKSKNNDKIQGSFTPFRMTTKNKAQQKALNDTLTGSSAESDESQR
jgi:hypothetical protein